MIIIKLQGGLGNQMFQYAAALSLAGKLGDDLKLDITTALGKGVIERSAVTREYELGKFNVSAKIATAPEIVNLRGKAIHRWNLLARAKRKIRRRFGKRLALLQKHGYYYYESDYIFDKKFFSLRGELYLDGYFQSYKYFEDIAALLRQEFMIKPQSCKAIKLQSGEKLSQKNVSVHIRRGDYVTDQKTNLHHGMCSLDYYERAMKFVASKIANPQFYIFSDDLDWCKANLKTEHQLEFVDWCQSAPEEIMLMSKCAHNIIANSSFSWWGAWLNHNPEKIVVAPKKWFNVNKDTSDLIPLTWIKL